MDMTKFKSTYPASWKQPKERQDNPDDVYASLAKQRVDTIPDYHKGVVCIGKSVEPKEIGQPNRMATLGEMLKVWDHVNEELYKRLIFIRYHNA